MRTILPIGALFSGSLILSNFAYLSLSVSFIQMLKVGESLDFERHAHDTSFLSGVHPCRHLAHFVCIPNPRSQPTAHADRLRKLSRSFGFANLPDRFVPR